MAEIQEQRGLWEEAPPVEVGEEDSRGQRALSDWESGSQETKPLFYPDMAMSVPPMPSGAQGLHTALLVFILSEESQTLVSCPKTPNLHCGSMRVFV